MADTSPEREVLDPARLAAVARSGLLDSGPEESFDRIGSLARRLVGTPVALVSIIDRDRQHFKCCIGLPEPYAGHGETPLSHSVCQHALAGTGPLLIADSRVDPRTAGSAAVEELGAIAYLGIPLVGREGHALGSFCVIDKVSREWTVDEVELMQDLAAAVMAEIELRELVLERDRALARAAGSERQLRAMMDSLFIFVGLLDTDGTVIDANAAALDAAGLSADDVVGQPFWETSWWSWDQATQDQLRAAIDRAAGGQSSRYDAEIRLREDQHTVIDFQLMPLRDSQGQITALVPSGLDISERKRFEDELALLADIEATQRRQAENLLTLARALTGALEIADIVALVTTLGSEMVGAAFANVGLADEAEDHLVLRHGAALEASIGDSWPSVPIDESTPLGSVVVTGRPVFLGDPAAIEGQFPIGTADARAAGFQALAAVPVLGRPTAAVGFAWFEPTEFTPGLQNALAIVAQLVGQALERAELYEREHQVANRLQRSLLPSSLPVVEGAEIAARYEAGADGLDVGGDWFDVVSVGDRSLLVIGDVVGRGLAAAAVMGQLRNACAALAVNVDDPAQLVVQLDQFTLEVADARLSTMIASEYDPGTRALRTVSAGHLPPLVRRADGTVVRLDGAGPPLGFAAGVARTVRSDTLDPGDCIVLYTDGLVERPGETIDVGIARLATVLDGASASSAEGLCDLILEQMGVGANDDIAILVLAM